MRWASFWNSRPASVRRTEWRSRTNRSAPSSFSRLDMCPESTDCEMKKLFAVSVKFRVDVSSRNS